MAVLQFQNGAVLPLNPARSDPWRRIPVRVGPLKAWNLYGGVSEKKNGNVSSKKRENKICTADELHYVAVPSSDWRLALWRYLPSSEAPQRNHPLLLLSGVGTNAIGYDLSPESSFARYMSGQGFDTWILEVRGAGLSSHGVEFGEGREPVALPFNFQEKLSTSIENFQKQLDLIVKNDWDFDNYLEEDVPAVMEYIRTLSKPKDGKLLAVGHSMGGIVLYAMLSRCCFEGKDSGFASVITLASSLDYRPSKSLLRLLLPLKDPIQALNIPVVPLGAVLAAIHPFASRPPYVLSWLKLLVSAQDMMHPELFEKLVFNNFGNIPIKLLSQLTTVFQEGGLCDRSGTFFYKDHIGKSNVPVLALAGDQDLICPTEAVYETVKLIPEHVVSFKVFGEPRGPHYAHYDLVGSHMAAHQVYPCVIEFLTRHDMT